MQCQLDNICACRTPAGIRDALVHLPKGLNETYDRIIAKVMERGPEDIAIALKTLMWLVGALKPLTVQQLADAMLIGREGPTVSHDHRLFDAREVLDVCGSLVHYNQETHEVILSHYTVQVRYPVLNFPISLMFLIIGIFAAAPPVSLLPLHLLFSKYTQRDKHLVYQLSPLFRA